MASCTARNHTGLHTNCPVVSPGLNTALSQRHFGPLTNCAIHQLHTVSATSQATRHCFDVCNSQVERSRVGSLLTVVHWLGLIVAEQLKPFTRLTGSDVPCMPRQSKAHCTASAARPTYLCSHTEPLPGVQLGAGSARNLQRPQNGRCSVFCIAATAAAPSQLSHRRAFGQGSSCCAAWQAPHEAEPAPRSRLLLR